MKKIVSFALALLMVLTMLPAVFASGLLIAPNPMAKKPALDGQSAAEKLNGLGLLAGVGKGNNLFHSVSPA